MPRFGKKSRNALKSCDNRLQLILNEVIKKVDCSVLEGNRGQVEQDKAYKEGRSKVKYPHGRHNQLPSRAVDVVPYPVDWSDRERFTLFAGYVLGVADQLGIHIRWGGDWDKDWYVHDNRFDDFPHFELLDVPGNDKTQG